MDWGELLSAVNGAAEFVGIYEELYGAVMLYYDQKTKFCDERR